MEIEARKLPYDLFEKIGFSKKDVLNLPSEDMKNLLNGKTTRNVVPINIKMEGIDFKDRAKLSLYTLPDESIGLKVHPYRKEIQNEFNLNKEELSKLKAGELISKVHPSLNGVKEKYVFQLDPDINEIKKARIDDVKVPAKLDGLTLTNQERELLASGKRLTIKNSGEPEKVVGISLINEKGYEAYALTEKKLVRQDINLEQKPGNKEAKEVNVTDKQLTLVMPKQEKDNKIYARDQEGNFYMKEPNNQVPFGKGWSKLDDQVKINELIGSSNQTSLGNSINNNQENFSRNKLDDISKAEKLIEGARSTTTKITSGQDGVGQDVNIERKGLELFQPNTSNVHKGAIYAKDNEGNYYIKGAGEADKEKVNLNAGWKQLDSKTGKEIETGKYADISSNSLTYQDLNKSYGKDKSSNWREPVKENNPYYKEQMEIYNKLKSGDYISPDLMKFSKTYLSENGLEQRKDPGRMQENKGKSLNENVSDIKQWIKDAGSELKQEFSIKEPGVNKSSELKSEGNTEKIDKSISRKEETKSEKLEISKDVIPQRTTGMKR